MALEICLNLISSMPSGLASIEVSAQTWLIGTGYQERNRVNLRIIARTDRVAVCSNRINITEMATIINGYPQMNHDHLQ